MTKRIKKIIAAASAAAMALSIAGCKEQPGADAVSAEGDPAPELRTFRECLSDLFSMGSFEYDFKLSMSGADPDGEKQDLSVSFGGVFSDDPDNGGFEARDISIGGSVLEQLGVGPESAYIGDIVFSGSAAYLNAKPFLELAAEAQGADLDDYDNIGWLKVSLDDVNNITAGAGIDAGASELSGEGISEAAGRLSDSWSGFMPKILGEESDWIKQDGETYGIHIDKAGVKAIGDNILAILDSGELQSFITSAYPDMIELMSLIPGFETDDFYDASAIDWDSLRSEIESADYDSMGDFSIDMRLSASSETDYMIMVSMSAFDDHGNPVSMSISVRVRGSESVGISVPEDAADLMPVIESMMSAGYGYDYDYDYDYDYSYDYGLAMNDGAAA